LENTAGLGGIVPEAGFGNLVFYLGELPALQRRVKGSSECRESSSSVLRTLWTFPQS
jgi:hypothetical protein